MAEPLSFVASVIAVASLAEKVVISGYSYLKAVRNCPDEVRNLMVETNVLCGILGRLSVLLGGDNSKSSKKLAGQGSADSDETGDEEDFSSREDDMTTASRNGTSNSSIPSAKLPPTYSC